MDIQERREGDIDIIAIIGSVDSLNSVELSDYLSGAVAQGRTRLLIDMGGIDFMSSAGLRALLAGLKECRQADGDMRLAAAQPGVDKILKMSGFMNILKVYPTVTMAIAEYI